MSKPELVTAGEFGSNSQQVELNGHRYFLETAKTQQDLEEAKALDDLAFDKHLGISMEEIIEIMNNGVILLLRDQFGQLIGESQVLTAPIQGHPNLAPDETYLYGIAIHPAFQNHGLAQILFEAQNLVALEAGKRKNTLTVRVENAQSIRGSLKSGYRVSGYDPECYGPVEEGGARLTMEKDHYNPTKIPATELLIQKFLSQEILQVNLATVEGVTQKSIEFLAVPVKIGDEVDYEAHALVSYLFATNKYSGVGLLKPSEINLNDSRSILVLKRA